MSEISVDSDDYFAILLDEARHNRQDPHRLLFLAVIFQALLDATKPENENESAEAVLARDRAKGWFFAPAGVTATDFETVCDLASVDPEQVRTFATRVLRDGTETFIRRKINAILNH